MNERSQDLRPPRPVLYVEDHPVNAMVMSALFDSRPQFKLVLAVTGQQALCIAAGLNPELLLLDMRLPDCHGLQLLPLLRQLPGCETAPAVAVTAEDDFVLPGSGFVELWRKPLDVSHVLKRLDALTGSTADDLNPDSPRTAPPKVVATRWHTAAPHGWR